MSNLKPIIEFDEGVKFKGEKTYLLLLKIIDEDINLESFRYWTISKDIQEVYDIISNTMYLCDAIDEDESFVISMDNNDVENNIRLSAHEFVLKCEELNLIDVKFSYDEDIDYGDKSKIYERRSEINNKFIKNGDYPDIPKLDLKSEVEDVLGNYL